MFIISYTKPPESVVVRTLSDYTANLTKKKKIVHKKHFKHQNEIYRGGLDQQYLRLTSKGTLRGIIILSCKFPRETLYGKICVKLVS